jgi:hypothetical protein
MKNIRSHMVGLTLVSLLAAVGGASLEAYTYEAPQRTLVQRGAEGDGATNEPQPRADAPTAAALPAQPLAKYRFIASSLDGLPARWNPCTTLTWDIDWAGIPAGFKKKAFAKEATQAMRELRATTGLGFTRSFEPGSKSIMIKFASRAEMPTEDTLAHASVLLSGSENVKQIVSSVITIDPMMRERPEFNPVSFRSILLHELGHSVGLDHADAESEVMYPFAQQLVVFQTGDRAALKQLGATNGCLPS